MKVLSLFDGISCGRVALERAGIVVEKYYASELDKYAIQISKKNYPDIVHIGDVCGVKVAELPFIPDLIIGGSPCQGFSFAGKQLAFNDPRSKLFFEYVRILNEARQLNPDIKFLLENVKMKKEFLDIISEHLGVQPVFINSDRVSAHHRQRFYWANWAFQPPDDKGIVLSDIIISDFVDREKSHCLDANYYKGGNLKSYFKKNRRQLVFMKQLPRGSNHGFEKSLEKSPSMTSSAWEQNNLISLDGLQFRKLMPVECERLQTLPDNYTQGVSNTQRYKSLGNGWTVDVIAHIFKQMKG